MAPSAVSVEAFEQAYRRRLRIVLVFMAAGDVAVAAILLWFYLLEALPVLWWIPLYVIVVLPVSMVCLMWVLRRSGERLMSFIDLLRPRLQGASASSARQGFWFLFDNGLVMTFGQQPGGIAFRVYGSEVGAPMRPTLETVAEWNRHVRLTTRASVTSKSGDPALRQGLERFRIVLQARWVRIYLLERTGRPRARADGPGWVLVFVAFVPRFTERGRDILNALDDLALFLDHALPELVSARVREARSSG